MGSQIKIQQHLVWLTIRDLWLHTGANHLNIVGRFTSLRLWMIKRKIKTVWWLYQLNLIVVDGCKGEYCQRCTLLSAIRSVMENESKHSALFNVLFLFKKKQPRRTNFLKFVFVDEMQIKCWREETKTSCRRYGGSPATDGSPDVGSSLFIRSASAPGKRARAPPSETR